MDPPPPARGTKRPHPDSEETLKPIKRLDKKVVDKIAAGEIIQRPSNALKELIENSIDAGSTQIDILIREGGIKLLQITDNGHGIRKEDLPILCERFTTSKISKFEDLESIMSYGFRGEALASISHISHLTVTTKTKDEATAWRAHYSEGALVAAKAGTSADPKPVAGKIGTQITAEDLFYNIPLRSRILRNLNEEYNRILDVVSRYAVHSAGIGFSCKKHGDVSAGVTTQAKATVQENIRTIYGSSIANELLHLVIPKDPALGFEAEGYITNSNYHAKKTTFLLFINSTLSQGVTKLDRSVDSTSLRRAVEQVYTTFLPKGGHPFIYLSVLIEPQRVDVNIHPTKREVGFLNEEEIIEKLSTEIRNKLGEGDSSRRFTVQTLLPGAKPVESQVLETQGKKPYSNYLVRTDPQTRKITSMFSSQAGNVSESQGSEGDYEIIPKERVAIKLGSVRELREEIMEVAHNELTELFANHTFVGIVDPWRRLAAVQHGVKLYLVDYGAVCYEFFYQIALSEFGNFGTIQFEEGIFLRDLLECALEVNEAGDMNTQAEEIDATVEILVQRRDMISEYFSMNITSDGVLESVPLLLKNYTPYYGKLPTFIRRLGRNVDWFTEKPCFESFLRELALFYTPEPIPLNTNAEAEGVNAEGVNVERVTTQEIESGSRREYVLRAIEEVLFPELRRRFIAVKKLITDKRVVEVADLPGLYRIFERC